MHAADLKPTEELGRPPLALDQAEASRFLREVCGIAVAPLTLRKLRCVGGGPPFYKACRRVFYERDTLRAWGLAQRSPVVTSTSELPRPEDRKGQPS